VDVYAVALADGRYRNISDASRVCARDIERLYASLRAADPHHYVASRERPFGSLRRRMVARLRALGLLRRYRRLATLETEVIARYARAFARGHHRDARQAARACLVELTHLPGSENRSRALTVKRVQARILSRARTLMRPWGHYMWSPADVLLAERYARAIVEGRYANARLATEVCLVEMGRIHHAPEPVLPFPAVVARLVELTHSMGIHRGHPEWTEEEHAVVDRYLDALHAGRFSGIMLAATECSREMKRLPYDSGDYSAARRRSRKSVYRAMVHAVMGTARGNSGNSK
jgi:hypothetical protein